MESFGFDLDKALDELEKLEEDQKIEETTIENRQEINDYEEVKDLIQNLILKIENESLISLIIQDEVSPDKIPVIDLISNSESVQIEVNNDSSETIPIKILEKNEENEKEEITHETKENFLDTQPSTSVSIEVTDYKTEWEQLSNNEKVLGLEAPAWLPDSEAENCMKCDIKFTFRKRRHHCRACGLIFCSNCCYQKLPLPYKLNNNSIDVNEQKKEISRVCTICYDIINKVNEIKSRMNFVESNVPIVSVLKKIKSGEDKNELSQTDKESNLTRRKSVRFSDGLIPGQSLSFNEEHNIQNEIFDASTMSFDEAKAISQIDSETHNGCILFKLSGNLRVHVSLIKIRPFGKCWLYVTHGLCVNAQDELVFILKNPSSELNEIPKQIIYHIMDIYEKSSKGHRISYMNHLLYNFDSEKLFRDLLYLNPKNKIDSTDNSLFGNKNNSGFLYFRPTKHHLDSLLKNYQNYLPDQPYLIGYLIQKWEIPWVKLFPLRLFLRLGEQFNVYPCPVISDSNRKAVYGEICHTIMSLLSDTRNFQYTIPQIDGVSIMTDEISTCISIPESQYDLVIKSLLTSNEYVFSFASLQFNDTFDSYLVAIENENLDSYSSKKVTCCDVGKTGVGFVVFNGAFKTTMTQNAKKTVIEDGVMIQIDVETLNKLKQALQSMNSFRIDCSKVKPDHTIIIEWIKEDDYLNRNILSVVDGKSMEGIKSLRLANTIDYVYEDKILKWIEIYILKLDEEALANDSNFNLNKFTEMISTATCMALNPLIDDLIYIQNENLKEANSEASNFFKPFRIGLRIEINKDQVGYMLGMCKKQISESKILESLDNHLIQILHQINSSSVNLMLELVFYVQEKNKAR